MKFYIAGVEFPAEYTVATEQALKARFGSVEKVQEMMSTGELADRTQELPAVIETLIAAGIQREKRAAELLGMPCVERTLLTAEDIEVLCHPGELLELLKEAMQEGYKTEIRLEKPKEKNGAATRSA